MNINWFKLKRKLLNNIVWILLVLAVAVVGGLEPSFFKPTILGNVLSQATVLGILSFAQAFAIMLGLIDLSLLGVMSFSATCGLLLLEKGCPAVIAILVIFLTGACIGALNGVLIAKLKAVALVETLAVKLTLLGAFLVITQGRAITNMPDSYKWFGQGSIAGIPTLPIALVAVFVFVYILWNKTPYGRSLYAVGGNEDAARVAGINVDKIKIQAYLIEGALLGLASTLMASRLKSASPNLGVGYELDAIAGCIIGGVSFTGGIGKVFDMVLGALIIGVINNGMDLLGVEAFYKQVVKGSIIVVAVLIDRKRSGRS